MEYVEVPEGAVIIIRDDSIALEEGIDQFAAAIHEHHPKSLIVVLDRESSFETMPLETLKALLEDLIAHEEALEARNGRAVGSGGHPHD